MNEQDKQSITTLRQDIRIDRLVAEIKRIEAGGKPPRMIRWEDYATGLYTLRAWMRGKLHRLNPPEPLRNYCRSRGIPIVWCVTEHNRKIAELFALKLPVRDSVAA